MLRWGLLGVSWLALSACDGPTQLLVIVDSDVQEVASVEVTATSGLVASARRFDVASTGWPFSLAVVPGAEGAEDVSIHAIGSSADGASLVGYVVRTRFLAGRTLRVEVPLARACITEPRCEDSGQRCLHGACVDQRVDPNTLPQGSGPPTSLFDGVAPVSDAGLEPLDGGCDAPCHDPANPCRVGRVRCDGDLPACDLTETLPDGASCGEGRYCDAAGQCGR